MSRDGKPHRCPLGTATTFSLSDTDLIPLLLNEPLDHPANCGSIGAGKSEGNISSCWRYLWLLINNGQQSKTGTADPSAPCLIWWTVVWNKSSLLAGLGEDEMFCQRRMTNAILLYCTNNTICSRCIFYRIWPKYVEGSTEILTILFLANFALLSHCMLWSIRLFTLLQTGHAFSTQQMYNVVPAFMHSESGPWMPSCSARNHFAIEWKYTALTRAFL